MKAVLLCAIVVLCTLGAVSAHSYVTSPVPRDPYTIGCRIGGPSFSIMFCPGPCELPYSPNQPHHNVQRGEAVQVQWPRNNHPGGFIRISWMPADNSDSHALFDENVQRYGCHEVSCHADAYPGEDNGDSNGSDGSVNPCIMDITVPLHLKDGVWTMQWAWYGGAWGLIGDYYNCVNFNVKGGPTGPQLPPFFKGGDVSNENDNQCEFWSTDRLHYCVTEPCHDICTPQTSPVGSCKDEKRRGKAYIDTWEPLFNAQPTTQTPQPTSDVSQVTTKYVPPTALPTQAPPAPFEVIVTVTVILPIPPGTFDTTVFAYDLTVLLDIPTSAIKQVQVKLDESSSTMTVITFVMVNAIGPDGNPIDPVDAAQRLKELADKQDPQLSQFSLGGLQYVNSETASSSQNVIVPLFALLFALLLFV